MSLENQKEELEKLTKERNSLWDYRDGLTKKIKNYKDLQDRSECPYCHQKTNKEHYRNEVPALLERLEEYLARLDKLYPKIKLLEKPIADENYRRMKEKQGKVQDYLKNNRNKLNKAIRDYNNGKEHYLPSIPAAEKELWNSAMEFQLDNRGLDENEELCYEV